MSQISLTATDLRKSVEMNKVVALIESLHGLPRLTVITTLACALGITVGGEAKSSEELLVFMAALSFIMHDAALMAQRGQPPVMGEDETVTLMN